MKGFTLIELLVVVLIIGILASVALPQYQVAVLKSRVATAMSNVKSLADAAEVYYMANGMYAKDDITGFDFGQVQGCTNKGTGQLDCGSIQYDYNVGGGNFSVGDMSFFAEGNERVDARIYEGNTLVLNYAQYLNFSPNYPGERHCQASNKSKTAHKVCKSMGGVEISSGLYRLP